jgi:DNA-directed RNA polymerase subunit RPC12/RpoP
VIRDNRTVFGAGWIDSIEASPGRKIRYRCPSCTSTDFKYHTRKQFFYRCANCMAEFNEPAEEELVVQVLTANYARTWRPVDRPFPEGTLDMAYVA